MVRTEGCPRFDSGAGRMGGYRRNGHYRIYIADDPHDLIAIARHEDSPPLDYKGRFKLGDVLIATETFVTVLDGQEVTVHKDVTRVRAGHPLAEGHASSFKPLDVHYEWEDASSRPRGGTRRSKKSGDE